MNKLSLPREGRILCAVSGGADSMCLLYLLYSMGRDVVAAHFEHGIRGGESLRDAAFVENWCRERGIPCVTGHGDAPAYAREKGMSLEEAARMLRYQFLEETAAEQDCAWIATAHNGDDNVETVLLHLTRGAGALGLSGIPARRGKIIRPLLGVSRREIEEYLEENAVPHVEDSSNQSDDYSRNRIRHRVTPVLREMNPGLNEAVGRTARLLAQDEDCLGGLARDFIDRFYDGESLPTEPLLALHGAVASRVIRRLCRGSLSMEQVEAVLSLARSRELKYLDLPGQRLRQEQGRLYFREREKLRLPERQLIPGQWVQVPELGLELLAEYGMESGEVNGLFKTYRFKCENIGSTVLCGGRQAGDKMRLRGRGCTKSLKSLFLEAGYTQQQRDRTLVLRDEMGVLAAVGLGVDERVKAGPNEPVLIIKIREIEQEKAYAKGY
ncbi:MAG: tRNA lysidine(34) synthetase TilS [Candidatus Limivicinus sp.]